MTEESNTEENISHICPICEKMMEYDGMGQYICENCGTKDYDDFGRVREYLYENGTAKLEDISKATEVPVEKIQQFIDEGRFELVMHCVECGAEIKRGMYCISCQRKTLRGIFDAMKDSDTVASPQSQGKMHNAYNQKKHHQYFRVKS